MKTLFLAVILVFLFLNAPVVNACSCGGYPAVCGAYESADAVFIGVVQNVEARMAKTEDGREYIGGQDAKVQVEKSFKGTPKPEVVFRSEGSSCDPVYEEGQRWLFFAYYNKESRKWRIAACGRSKVIDGGSEELRYLERLPKSATTTRISGELKHYEDDPVKGFTAVKNIIGAKVKIIGESKTYETFTDKDGIYEIYGLPPGKYKIDPEIPLGLRVRFPIHYGPVDYVDRQNIKLVLDAKSCASVDFILSSKNRIAGRVFGADGVVFPNVCLNLIPKDKQPTRDQGRFTLNVLAGLTGSLRGFMYSYKGKYENCPQLDKLVKEKGVSDVRTKPMPLEITSDLQDIKLTFPFPYCKKAKVEN